MALISVQLDLDLGREETQAMASICTGASDEDHKLCVGPAPRGRPRCERATTTFLQPPALVSGPCSRFGLGILALVGVQVVPLGGEIPAGISPRRPGIAPISGLDPDEDNFGGVLLTGVA